MCNIDCISKGNDFVPTVKIYILDYDLPDYVFKLEASSFCDCLDFDIIEKTIDIP